VESIKCLNKIEEKQRDPKDGEQKGRRAKEQRAEEIRAEEIRAEEIRAEGRRAEGRRAEGRRAEGRRAEGRRAEGRRAERNALYSSPTAPRLALTRPWLILPPRKPDVHRKPLHPQPRYLADASAKSGPDLLGLRRLA
jgi:hypothetical protein